MKKLPAIFLFSFLGISLFAQDVIQIRPGQMYEEGSTIESPRYGFEGTIPSGYVGMLPQGTEIFMLNKKDGTSGEVLMFARPEGNLDELIAAWQQGANLTDAIYLSAAGEITREGDMAYAEVTGKGERINTSYKGFIAGRCGPYGPCVTLLMITPQQFYETTRREMLSFMRQSRFVEPNSRSPYENFDWKEFLSGKVLVTYSLSGQGKRENMIHLCEDGTFSSSIRQSGFLKQENKAYLGKNSGTWQVEGSGPETTLRLAFDKKKIPAFDVVLNIEDEKVYAAGERYYAGYSDHCNK